jgi:hypothetical protein
MLSGSKRLWNLKKHGSKTIELTQMGTEKRRESFKPLVVEYGGIGTPKHTAVT